ncbi:MAG: hypothetical protein DI626_05715 [Micavibrio aeruginosavorus]|uniref:Uncharacterized protein n=1 Tax=Micavibrio aeruginosavorus TaxID=349221 RepID=A0A2W4ZZC7_9BACT|nr:MAG: hypothetical protein DI626_05715 [Micavibrio aeruginosavorus]
MNIDFHAADAEADNKRQTLKRHFYNSSAFLGAHMKSITVHEKARPADIIRPVSCDYHGLHVHFTNSNEQEKFYISGMQGDSTSPRVKTEEKYINNLLLETTKAAYILVHNAKLSGWDTIDFGETSDPIRIMALEVACQKIGVSFIAKDKPPLPETYHGENLHAAMINVLENFENRPTKSPRFSFDEDLTAAPKTNKASAVAETMDDDDLLAGFVPPASAPAAPTP